MKPYPEWRPEPPSFDALRVRVRVRVRVVVRVFQSGAPSPESRCS